jgi:hypothetical protein
LGRARRPKPTSPFEMDTDYKILESSDDNIEEQMNEYAAKGYKFKTTLSNGKKILMEKSLPQAVSRKDSKLREVADQTLSGRRPGSVDVKTMDAAFDRAEKAANVVKDMK